MEKSERTYVSSCTLSYKWWPFSSRFVCSSQILHFTKELPLVLKAFAHGDGNLLNNYPDLQEALVWVYFHSNIPEFNRVECWGPLKEAGGSSFRRGPTTPIDMIPSPCQTDCSCCFPPMTSIHGRKM
ncbi:putative staygreen protein [Helianthus annuus]|nr:putative staygreen protein [Helianthus annuus]